MENPADAGGEGRPPGYRDSICSAGDFIQRGARKKAEERETGGEEGDEEGREREKSYGEAQRRGGNKGTGKNAGTGKCGNGKMRGRENAGRSGEGEEEFFKKKRTGACTKEEDML